MKHTNRFLFLLYAAVLFCLVAISPSAIAQVSVPEDESISPSGENAEGLSMEVKACFGSVYRFDCYFPIKITLENTGHDRRGEIRIVSQDTAYPLPAVFTAKCVIPANSRKTYYLYPYVNLHDPSPSIYVQYVEREVLLNERIDLSPLADDEILWLEIADEGSDFIFLSSIPLPSGSSISEVASFISEESNLGSFGYGGSYGNVNQVPTIAYPPLETNVIWTRPENLPDRTEGYESVDGIILNTRRFYEMSPEQQNALKNFVLAGGQMIFWLGDDPERYQGSFLTAQVDGSSNAGISAINQGLTRTTLTALHTIPGFTSSREVLGNFPVTYTTQPSARILLADNDIPVLQHITYGSGDILLSGLDLSVLKNSAPLGLDVYMAFMLGYLRSQDERMPRTIKSNTQYGWYGSQNTQNPFITRSFYHGLWEINNVLQSDNLTKLPPLSAIIWFLFAYIVIVGPVNYIILNKLRMRELLWITIPIVVTVFIFITYTWALSTKGSKLLLTRLNIVDVYQSTEISWESSYFGLFSPAARNYTVQLDAVSDLTREIIPPDISMYQYGAMATPSTSDIPRLVQDDDNGPLRVEDAYIRIWSERHFVSSGEIASVGTVYADNVAMRDNHLSGTLHLNLTENIQNLSLVYYTRGGFASQYLIDTIEAGPDAPGVGFDLNIDMRSSNLTGIVVPNTELSGKARQLRSIATAVFANRAMNKTADDELILIGWKSGAGARSLVSPGIRSSVEETLFVFHIPLNVDVSDEIVDSGRNYIYSINAAHTEVDNAGNLLLTDGAMMIGFSLAPTTIIGGYTDSLDVVIGTDSKGSRIRVYGFDRYDNLWVPIQQINYRETQGESGGYRITFRMGSPGRFLCPDGRTILIRLEGDPDIREDVISINNIYLSD